MQSLLLLLLFVSCLVRAKEENRFSKENVKAKTKLLLFSNNKMPLNAHKNHSSRWRRRCGTGVCMTDRYVIHRRPTTSLLASSGCSLKKTKRWTGLTCRLTYEQMHHLLVNPPPIPGHPLWLSCFFLPPSL